MQRYRPWRSSGALAALRSARNALDRMLPEIRQEAPRVASSSISPMLRFPHSCDNGSCIGCAYSAWPRRFSERDGAMLGARPHQLLRSSCCPWHVDPSRHWGLVADGSPKWQNALQVRPRVCGSGSGRRSSLFVLPGAPFCDVGLPSNGVAMGNGGWARAGSSCPPAVARRHIAGSGVGICCLLGRMRWPPSPVLERVGRLRIED